MEFANGVPADQIPGVTWQKARASQNNGNCVEVAALPDGGIAVRNSRDPGGPALVFNRDEAAAFFSGVKDAEFDHIAA